MTKNLAFDFDFDVDKTNKTITVTREFDAPLPLVWDAYTKSEILDKWWAPKPWKAKTGSMDFREGGKWQYAMVGPEGEEHWAVAFYDKIDPLKGFVVRDAFADAQGNINTEMPQSKWDTDFTDLGDRTRVKFVITYPDLAQLEEVIKMGFKEGLTLASEGLDELLPTLKQQYV
jgi:uncharacterized protein YndB with AHSA1/START domain